MKVMSNPADKEEWIPNACPACGSGNIATYEEGLARKNLNTGEMDFVETQPIYFVKCNHCMYVGRSSTIRYEALRMFLNDKIESEQLSWIKELGL